MTLILGMMTGYSLGLLLGAVAPDAETASAFMGFILMYVMFGDTRMFSLFGALTCIEKALQELNVILALPWYFYGLYLEA